MSYMLLEGVSKRYNQRAVIKQVSFSLEKGKLATLLGPSGCGKSTLLRLIAGLTKVDEGVMYIDSREITHLAPRERNVGMVFQSYALFPNMTVFENIAFGLRMKNAANIRERVREMIDLVDLGGKEDAYPHELSGGQQQRVALARSLVMRPKVLLLDEPLSALDAQIRRILQAEIRRIQQELKMTTIFVTHDQEEAMILSDVVHVMNDGEIVQSGTPAELYSSPRSRFVAKFIGSYNLLPSDDFQRLIPEAPARGKEVAIRPEAILLVREDEPISGPAGWLVRGRIQAVEMRGSIIRYEVTANGVSLQVDQLHRNNSLYPIGHPVKLLIPRDQCLYFE